MVALYSIYRHIYNATLDFILPHKCLICDSFDVQDLSVCSSCWGEMKFSQSNCCSVCSLPFEYNFGENAMCPACIENAPNFDQALYVFAYNSTTAPLITRYKYSDKTFYGKYLKQIMLPKISNLEFDIVTSVPISLRKLLKRKYNQSALLAARISKDKNIPVNNLLLKKIKYTPSQASLTRKERLTNVKNSFAVNPKFASQISGKNILLIDDVFTTGATANECAKILKKSGAGRVCVLTAARTIIEENS